MRPLETMGGDQRHPEIDEKPHRNGKAKDQVEHDFLTDGQGCGSAPHSRQKQQRLAKGR